MQPAPSTRIADGFMAALRLGGEKPHQGLPSSNPALYQGPNVCNSTTALGLRGQAELNRVGSRCTGKERDTESGNDYFGARYYSSAMGRFMSPDWSDESDPVPFAEFENPQSLNLYAYVNNNPLRSVDPDGHMHQECQHVGASSSSDANGNITMTTAHDVCNSVPDFWDYPSILAKKAGSATRQWADNHQNLGKALAADCPDPANCVQVGMVPWGMTGGLSGGSILKIIEQDADAIHAVIQTSKGPIEVMANMTKEGDKLVLKEVHVGEGVRLTNSEIRQAARELGRQEGVSSVEVQGGVRTGGANPGQWPPAFTVKVQ